DRARSLAECYVDTNDEEEVDTVYRYFRMTARAIAMRQGWTVPQKIQDAAAKPDQANQLLSIIHAVYPRPKGERSRYHGKAFASCYVVEEEKALLEEDGYYEFPYMVPRWDIAEGEPYGRGLGHTALADVKSLNIGRKSNLNIADRVGRPALLAHSELDTGGSA